MKIVVPVKQVPDLVEDLEVGPDGVSLDEDVVKYVLNEFDDHALEEALQLKEAGDDVEVVAVALDYGEVDQVLFTCLAKGADRAIKVSVSGDWDGAPDGHTTARALASTLSGMEFDLVLTGVQAIDDLDGQVGPLLATLLEAPHVSVATHLNLSADGRALTVQQEYGAGITAELEVDLPAVIGVQAARETPRYASVSRVRQLMRSAELETASADVSTSGALRVERLFKPVSTTHAQMLEGSPEDVADAIAQLLADRGLLKG